MTEKEQLRLDKMLEYERALYAKGYEFVCGIDEAGRGPLCGPVVAAAVILKKDDHIEGVNDSKKLSEKKREQLFETIKERAVAWSVGIVDEETIDNINILEATRLAMKKAVEGLKQKPDYALVDAEKKVPIDVPYSPIIKGDALSETIAAASIIAKVTRDHMIIELDKEYPEYGFAKNKGYGTKEHTEAIKKYGLCKAHRKSFCKKFI
ncbi:MAG: ribonuclease HII [Clostridia bacterium]|nr:ribonuclease HII [Clostridia bacterium]MBR6641754.1 ribonuclease HII [Clostridia bacterium]